MSIKYTDEKNVQILIALLKKHGIKDVIINPGTTNISFVASIQNDDFFNIYSCVDERSSAYMACGIAAQTGQPVVLTCTGATASRNYFPGLTEAHYRKLPIIAVTATQHLGRVGQNAPQVLNRDAQPSDTVNLSITIPAINSEEDHWACNLTVNNAILETKRNGGGPVHINMVTSYNNSFYTNELPDERVIHRISYTDKFPIIKAGKIAIFIGNHAICNAELTEAIEQFCEKFNSVVLVDHTSNYHGKYAVFANLVSNQESGHNLNNIELLINLGNVSGAYMNIQPKEVWRVNPDGEIRDTYKKLTRIFAIDELGFFKKYNKLEAKSNLSYYQAWQKADTELRAKFNRLDLPFSNIWIAGQIAPQLSDADIAHLGILNTLRSWNFHATDQQTTFYCNTGGFGIDGVMSTAIGNSLATNQRVFCFIGDLAFFYDLNSIGCHEIKNNLRILLINNGCGTEFHNFNHRAMKLASEYGNLDVKYIAADGHFGNQSPELVKHIAEDLGFTYLQASNKSEFTDNLPSFMAEQSDRPIIFEVFTNPADESEALRQTTSLNTTAKSIAKSLIGEKGKRKIKKLLRRA